ncbi:hypothetical protein EHH54_16385 [Rhizobium leguminosarum]|uniref:hypothetical protein n=1 Tax=Rhizobium TaxID=379 RepID=UPI000FEC7291|nr:hypothetical protein [Rhizobium leguminosarum]RWX39218.1 hypothetical protein EHH54_16385 [Rhizobium leguminosarum]
MSITTTHQLFMALSALSPTIGAMNLISAVPDADLEPSVRNFANSADIQKVAGAIEALTAKAGLSMPDATDQVKNVVQERHFYGTFCELAAYDWFARNGVEFNAQVNLGRADVLNPRGCAIDGEFTAVNAYFDIKGFGMQAYLMKLFREALRASVPDLFVTIDGPMDVGIKDIETYAFGQLSRTIPSLKQGAIVKIAQLGWTIRVQAPTKRIIMSEHTDDPYVFAENNRYYTLKTSRQFTRNAPFVMVFPYAARFNNMLSLNPFEGTDIALRALARRTFLQLHSDTSSLSAYDKQTAPGLTVADASKLLSAMLFVNVDKDDGWLFLNPRATHKFTKNHVEHIFDFTIPVGLGIDDFRNDDY